MLYTTYIIQGIHTGGSSPSGREILRFPSSTRCFGDEHIITHETDVDDNFTPVRRCWDFGSGRSRTTRLVMMVQVTTQRKVKIRICLRCTAVVTGDLADPVAKAQIVTVIKITMRMFRLCTAGWYYRFFGGAFVGGLLGLGGGGGGLELVAHWALGGLQWWPFELGEGGGRGGFSGWHFGILWMALSGARRRGFSTGTPVSLSSSLVKGVCL